MSNSINTRTITAKAMHPSYEFLCLASNLPLHLLSVLWWIPYRMAHNLFTYPIEMGSSIFMIQEESEKCWLMDFYFNIFGVSLICYTFFIWFYIGISKAQSRKNVSKWWLKFFQIPAITFSLEFLYDEPPIIFLSQIFSNGSMTDYAVNRCFHSLAFVTPKDHALFSALPSLLVSQSIHSVSWCLNERSLWLSYQSLAGLIHRSSRPSKSGIYLCLPLTVLLGRATTSSPSSFLLLLLRHLLRFFLLPLRLPLFLLP